MMSTSGFAAGLRVVEARNGGFKHVKILTVGLESRCWSENTQSGTIRSHRPIFEEFFLCPFWVCRKWWNWWVFPANTLFLCAELVSCFYSVVKSCTSSTQNHNQKMLWETVHVRHKAQSHIQKDVMTSCTKSPAIISKNCYERLVSATKIVRANKTKNSQSQWIKDVMTNCTRIALLQTRPEVLWITGPRSAEHKK